MRASFSLRICVAAAAAAAATAEAPSLLVALEVLAPAGFKSGDEPASRLSRRPSGDGEEAPLRAARGGGASTEAAPAPVGPLPLPRAGVAPEEGDEEEGLLDPRELREGDPVPEAPGAGARRFSDGLMILRGIGAATRAARPVLLDDGEMVAAGWSPTSVRRYLC